jgi:2,3-bisphosphoglycerate-dependent phosphoglycerate mutase
MSLTRIILVRHGESVVTVKRILGGPRSCTGLSQLGEQQAASLRKRIELTGEIQADVLYSSAYPRALQTAQIIAPAFAGLEINVEAGFGEHDPGPQCDGMTYVDFMAKYGKPNWGGDPNAVFFPGGETIAQFHSRVATAFDKVVKEHYEKTIVVACHGGVVDAVIRRHLKTPQTGAFEMHTKNCSLTELVEIRADHWALMRYNDHAHLQGLPIATNID